MSKVDFHRNTFLEIEELIRFQKFMIESSVNKTFLANTVNWGVIDTSGGTTPNDFKVEVGSGAGTVKIANLSRALQKNGLLIEQQPIDNISIPNDSSWYWLKIGHVYTHLEEGICSITEDGTVVGVGTKFTEVLRGVSTKVPVKIRFASGSNQLNYDVVNVIDDLNIIIQGDSFTAASNLKYYVVGSTPLGETVTSEQQEGLYSYDSCLITKVQETIEGLPPAGLLEDEEFWIARVINIGNTLTIYDKREYTVNDIQYSQYWEYYIKGVSDKLDKNNNLSDVNNKEVARGNLKVYSMTQVDNLLNITSVPWTLMNRGSATTSDTFDLKICRIGSTCSISGRFTARNGAQSGDIVASIPWSSLETEGLTLNLSTNIYLNLVNLSDSIVEDDKELPIYVEARGLSSDLQIKTSKGSDEVLFRFTLTFLLI